MADAGTLEKTVSLTENAAKRVRFLMEKEGKPDLFLRVTVSGGGCSGFQYGFALDDAQTGEDRVFERDGVKLVVDEVSLDLLGGAEIDFVQELVGSAFTVRNPNASSTCGCGSSFSV